MRTLSFPHSPLVLAALITVASFSLSFADEAEVVDPTTGETVAISEVDFDALTDDQRANVVHQLAEQGISQRGRGQARADLSEVEVTDPATGETVSLGDIDVASLSDEDRSNIGDQLAEQGIAGGRHGPSSDGKADADADADTESDTDADQGATGRGGKGRGGRGGLRD